MSDTLRLLIVDDNEMMVKTLQDIFKVKGFEVEVAFSAPEALQKIETISFDCVLSDIKMPDVSGVDLYKTVKARYPELPFVLMTAYAADKLVREGLAEGVVAVLTKPLNLELLLNFLSSLRRERSVVIVDDDPDFCQTLADILQMKDFVVTQVTELEGMMEHLEEEGQIVVLDMKLKQSNGLDVLQEIKAQYPHMPVVLVTAHRGDEVTSSIEAALEINAYTYFYKPVDIDRLIQTLTQIYHRELGRRLGRPMTKGL